VEAILDAVTMTYMECPQCGRKALSVATRCPHCGVAFPSQPLRRSASGHRLDRLRPLFAVGAVLVLGTVLLAVIMPRLESKPAAPARVTPSVDTTPALATPPAAAPADSTAEGAAPAPPGPLVKRFARTWVNVRSARGRVAPAVRVLNPGDAVQVDSLSRGWYRVLIDGRAAG
jgi:ribosomal protein L37E